ncbi:hypothetical protein PC129_g13337 [Phytophthora cactorum]|uniref:Uncharacterized protein n=1 Tax=Phytophthora cactorum TaxID=29920 RepID=A0A8T1HU60_9STRA|nr:hypothetical protein Pcac1_g6732 [Phytophthora cactorum]KAG3215793.1 hypothetical protein PC129_g13337 [Phytophthora cactorum]
MERLTVELGDKGAGNNSTTIRGVVRTQVSKKPQLYPCLSARTHTGRMPTLPEEWNQQCTNHSAARATAEEQDDRTVVSAKDSLADRMETLASTRTHNQGNQCTTKLRREDGEDRTAWRTEGTIDAEMTEATVNDHVQQQHVHEQPAETRTRTSTLISRQGKERHETEERGRSRTPSGVHPRQFGATAESERRAASTSPKRKIPTEWEDITIHKQQLHGARNAKTPRRQGVARSVSPRRAMKSTRRGRGRNAMQKYMHQFLKRSQSTNITLDTQSSNKSETGEQYRATDTATPSPEGVTSSQEYEIVGVVPPNDLGLPVEGLSPPSDETTKEENALKRQILNEMIANLADEAVMHPLDTFAEMEARRIQRAEALMTAEQICKLANHYVKMRQKSTTSSEAKDSSGGATPSDTAKQSVEESNAEELIKEEHENKRGADVSHNENPCNEEITDKTTTQGNSAARDQNHDVHD